MNKIDIYNIEKSRTIKTVFFNIQKYKYKNRYEYKYKHEKKNVYI